MRLLEIEESCHESTDDRQDYGGPQVSRQKFEVNATQLKKLRRYLFFIYYLSFRQALFV